MSAETKQHVRRHATLEQIKPDEVQGRGEKIALEKIQAN
jgi:hypothetical protein